MRNCLVRRWRVLLLPGLCLSFWACGSDSVDPGPTLSIDELAAALAVAVGADPPAQEAEKNIKNVAGATCKVMAQTGCSVPSGVSGPAAVAAMDAGVTSLFRRAPRIASWSDPLLVDGPALAPPLGATCVWNEDTDTWKGSSAIFGEVPGDRTRFEAYQTDDSQPGTPVEPLTTTGRFFDVAPVFQNTPEQPRSQINVELESTETSSGDAVVSLFLTGEVEPSSGEIVDLLMSGSSGSNPSSVMDYLFSVETTRSLNTMELQDLLIISDLDSTTRSGSFLVQKRDAPRQVMEFQFALGTTGLEISSGEVFVGTERIAQMSGSRAAPVFELEGNFDEVENLQFVYDEVLGLDSRVIDLFFVGYCVGANTAGPCQSMIDILGLPGL